MRNRVIIAILIIAVLGLTVFVGIRHPASTVPIMGYSGPVASFSGVDHNYDDPVTVTNHGTDISIEWYEWTDLFDILTSTGLRAELQGGVNVGPSEVLETIQKSVIDDVAKTNITENWIVQKVKCTMGVAIFTYKGGLQDTPGATFWVQLNENAYSVFQNTDESIAYMVNVYTTEPATIVGYMEVVPTSGGWDFPLTSVGSFTTPEWILESGYTSNLDQFKNVKFPLQVLTGKPSSVAGFFREESSAQFYIGIDVLLFGYWEETKDYRDFDIPDPADWWELLFDTLYSIAWVIVGVVLSAVAIWKVRGKTLLMVLGGVWVFVLFMGGFIDPLFDYILSRLT